MFRRNLSPNLHSVSPQGTIISIFIAVRTLNLTVPHDDFPQIFSIVFVVTRCIYIYICVCVCVYVIRPTKHFYLTYLKIKQIVPSTTFEAF
jgi:hypothetical protein